ncbi:MAG TPA: hypothetical protein PLU79_15030, partial [Burkholderiaceae bacterium]|nr:hypothetical protein [Burkholderiaceae bacterium]
HGDAGHRWLRERLAGVEAGTSVDGHPDSGTTRRGGVDNFPDSAFDPTHAASPCDLSSTEEPRRVSGLATEVPSMDP